MKGRISVGYCHTSYPRSACLAALSVLLVAVVCLGQQTPAQPPGRQEPAGRPEPAGRQPTRPRRVPPTQRLRTIQLPEPTPGGTVSFEQALLEQRNMQPPGNERLEFTKIGQLAWAAQGAMVPPTAAALPAATSPLGPAPVPPELTAMKVYFVVPDGLYLYNPLEHSLQQISDGDRRELMATALLKQPGAPTGGCQIILAGSSRDFTARSGTQARTAMLLQAGQMSQNIQLQAVALGLTFLSIGNVQGNDVRRVARIPRNLDPIYVAFVGYRPGEAPQTFVTEPAVSPGMRALFVLPHTGFQDEEYFQTRRALELAGVRVTLASSRRGPITGMLGGSAQADVLLNQVNVDNYNAVVFIGGIGTANYLNDPTTLNVARAAGGRGKVLAAIGTAPSILASAGLLRGVRTTAYISEQNRLALAGAIYTGNPVEKDGLMITATGPLAAGLFTQAILEGLGELRGP